MMKDSVNMDRWDWRTPSEKEKRKLEGTKEEKKIKLSEERKAA